MDLLDLHSQAFGSIAMGGAGRVIYLPGNRYIEGCQDLVTVATLPETNIFAPENGWLEYDRFLLGWVIFRGELLVSGRVNNSLFTEGKPCLIL